MSKSDEVRERYAKYLLHTGVNQKFLCMKLGLNESSLSRFKHKKLNLPEQDLYLLDNYISNAGY